MIPSKVITGFIKTSSPGITVLKQNQEEKAPAKPYAVWRRISAPSQGRALRNYGTTGGSTCFESIDLVKNQKIEVQFITITEEQAFKKGLVDFKVAEELADEFTLRMQSIDSLVFQAENNIGLLSWVDFTAFTQFMGDINEQRAVIELTINYVDNYQTETVAVDPTSIEITTTYEDL